MRHLRRLRPLLLWGEDEQGGPGAAAGQGGGDLLPARHAGGGFWGVGMISHLLCTGEGRPGPVPGEAGLDKPRPRLSQTDQTTPA